MWPQTLSGGRGPSSPNGPHGPLRGSGSAEIGAPHSGGGRRRRRASRGASGTRTCIRAGVSDFCAFQAAER
eukprot:11897995-Alexandrium_andersonii.AAC.1